MDIYSLTNTSCHLAQMLYQIHGERISAHAPRPIWGLHNTFTTQSGCTDWYSSISSNRYRLRWDRYRSWASVYNSLRALFMSVESNGKNGLAYSFFWYSIFVVFCKGVGSGQTLSLLLPLSSFSPLLFTRTNPCIQLGILSQYRTHCTPPLRKHFPRKWLSFGCPDAWLLFFRTFKHWWPGAVTSDLSSFYLHTYPAHSLPPSLFNSVPTTTLPLQVSHGINWNYVLFHFWNVYHWCIELQLNFVYWPVSCNLAEDLFPAIFLKPFTSSNSF